MIINALLFRRNLSLCGWVLAAAVKGPSRYDKTCESADRKLRSAGRISMALDRFIGGLALLLVGCHVSVAQHDRRSAKAVIPACQAWLATTDGRGRMPGIFEIRDQGYCIGVIEGLMLADSESCPPSPVTLAQAVRVVLSYIETRPAQMHEDFKLLSIQAMRAAWPCRR